MSAVTRTDICIIGAGSGGLMAAALAGQMGADTILIERGKMGGDCLNTGCVPSKALLAAAHRADAIRDAGHFGIETNSPRPRGDKIHQHIHSVIAEIAPHDSVETFAGYGVRVIAAEARFTGPAAVRAGEETIRARRFIIATGSRPMVPPIDGLQDLPYLTNETVFELTEIPERLLIIGGGPIGVEMADAYARLGARVELVEMGCILPRDDAELADVVRRALGAAGVNLRENTTVTAARGRAGDITLTTGGDGPAELSGSHLLVAAGRVPNLDDLGLDRAGVVHDRSGIRVDKRLRTSNRRIYAVGDVVGAAQFTHVAADHATTVIKNALLRLPSRIRPDTYPHVTYTDPELAQVGLTQAEAAAKGLTHRTVAFPFGHNDRAVAERRADGLIKIVVGRRGRILGAGIAGPGAGELIQVWALAISAGLGIGKMASMVAPYPSFGEISKRAAGEYFTPALFGEKTRKLVKFLARFG